MKAVFSLLLSCIIVASCAEPAGPTYDVTLVTGHAWSGGSIALRSAGFTGKLPVVIVANDSLQVTRVNDSTVTARLPPLPAGAYEIQVQGIGSLRPIAAVMVHGFMNVVSGPTMFDFPLPWPGPETPGVLANGADDHLLFLNLRTMAVHKFPDSVHNRLCTYGPGPSYRSDRIVLGGLSPTGGCGQWSIWAIAPDLSLTRMDTAIGVTDRLAAEISPTVRLVAIHHRVWTVGGTDSISPTKSYENLYESTSAIRISPGGEVATLHVSSTHDNGLPFFDGLTGSPRFHVRELGTGSGAAFSASGDTSFITGKDTSFDHALIIAVDAETGQRFVTDTLSNITPQDLALDVNGKWIYVAGWGTPGTNAVLVLNRFTLQVEGEFRFPAVCQLCVPRLVRSAPDRVLYLVGSGTVTSIARMDLGMPE